MFNFGIWLCHMKTKNWKSLLVLVFSHLIENCSLLLKKAYGFLLRNSLSKLTLHPIGFFVWVFLLCSSWMYFLIGLSKAINLFKLCLWFMVNFWELSKLVETPQTSVNEDWRGAKTTWTRLWTDWFILTADFWLDETAFPTCEKVDSRLWLDEKISVWVFHAIYSIWKSQ